MEFEEAMLHKEIRVQRLTENLEPAGAISEIRMLVQELKDQVLKLYQESSQKDQLLFDANFKIHMLSMTLAQKDLQLGFCDSLGLDQADHPCSYKDSAETQRQKRRGSRVSRESSETKLESDNLL